MIFMGGSRGGGGGGDFSLSFLKFSLLFMSMVI